MDDDVKTLLAIIALVYGSSNGIGLLKDAMNPVDENRQQLKSQMHADAATAVLKEDAVKLLKSLWSPFVLIHVLMVIIVPAFLFFVAIYGPITVLAFIGLAQTPTQPTQPSIARPAAFYWILFGLSLVATAHYLSKYVRAWWALIKYLRFKSPHAA